MKLIFWLSLFSIWYAYFGYPVSVFLIGLFRNKKVIKKEIYPTVTLLITAYNEEQKIRDKIENSLLIDYPKEKLQIIVASDGSTDDTHSIVKEYEGMGIELYVVKERGGKENAQKEALQKTTGDIIVFSDVSTSIESQGIKSIVANFADSTVGCVSSEDRLVGNDGKPCGEGFYVRYEMLLRRLESRVNTVVGLSGSLFAARKIVCRDFSGKMQSDFGTLLNSMKMGLRGVSDPESLGYYLDIADSEKEFSRKVRTVVRGLTVFLNHLEFLNIYKYGLFSYQYFCHKLLRWLVPYFLVFAFFSNLILSVSSSSSLYLLIFIFQILFYCMAILARIDKRFAVRAIFKIPTYFLIVNVAIFIAWYKYITGERVVMWNPSKRKN